MVLSLILTMAFLLPAAAEERIPAECRRLPAYDQALAQYSVNAGHTRGCREAVTAIMTTWQQMKSAKAKVRVGGPVGPADTQAGALREAGAVSEAGSITKEQFARIAAGAKANFEVVSESLEKRAEQLKKELSVVTGHPGVSEGKKAEFRQAHSAAAEDFKKLKATADSLVAEADKVSGEFQGEAVQLAYHSRQARETADRFEGAPQQAAEPKAEKGVSKNMMVGLGGAALITAGAVGGLYWVANKSIKQADNAAAARIAQADAAAAARISQAETAANNVISNAEAAAKRIITFAYDSLSRVIANAEEAANRIYDRAKADVNKLIDDLRNEVQESFANLTEKGLEKLRGELESMFSGLISRAKSEGNTKLAADLQKAMDSLSGQIGAEIQRRRSAASPTSSASATATSTASGTSTSTSTSTSSGTSTETGTSPSTATAISRIRE